MHFMDDPDEMSAEGRFAEVAAILAAGYVHHRMSAFTEKRLDSSEAPMAVCGLTDGESGRKEVAR
jgi:hypothetical protein